MKAAGLPLAVTAVAAKTPVGDDAAQTAASVRARLSRYRRHALLDATSLRPEWEDDEPMVVAAVADIDPELDGAERLAALLRPVLGEIVEAGGLGRRGLGETALSLALPRDEGAVRRWGLADVFLPELARRTGLAFAHAEVRLSGHAAMLAAVADAAAKIASGAVQRVIVAGVDSYLSFDRLVDLDRAWRAKSKRNADGFVPGEGATAVLVEAPQRARDRGRDPLFEIRAVGLGTEPNAFGADRHSSAVGLVEAVRDAWTGAAGPASWVLCDLNGESYRGFEWGVAQTRLTGHVGGSVQLVHPAECTGDVGAASGGLLFATLAAAFQRGWAPAREALAWTASDDGLRVAARVGA